MRWPSPPKAPPSPLPVRPGRCACGTRTGAVRSPTAGGHTGAVLDIAFRAEACSHRPASTERSAVAALRRRFDAGGHDGRVASLDFDATPAPSLPAAPTRPCGSGSPHPESEWVAIARHRAGDRRGVRRRRRARLGDGRGRLEFWEGTRRRASLDAHIGPIGDLDSGYGANRVLSRGRASPRPGTRAHAARQARSSAVTDSPSSPPSRSIRPARCSRRPAATDGAAVECPHHRPHGCRSPANVPGTRRRLQPRRQDASRAAGEDGSVRLWSTATGRPLGQPLQGHRTAVTAVAFTPDGATLASADQAGTVRLWDTTTRRPLGEPLLGHTGAVSAVAFSSDGKLLASAGVDGTIRLWDPSVERRSAPPGAPDLRCGRAQSDPRRVA